MSTLDRINLIIEEADKNKRWIIDAIKNPPTIGFKTVVNGISIRVSPDTDGVKFTFDPDEYELETMLADIVDDMGGYKFKSQNKGNAFNFIVMPKTRRDMK